MKLTFSFTVDLSDPSNDTISIASLTSKLAASEKSLVAAVAAANKGNHSFATGARHMATELDAITAQVTANTDAEASAVLLLTNLSETIAKLKGDPVALQALSDKLKTSAESLATAILANTPK